MVNPLVSYYGSNKVPTYFMIFLGVISSEVQIKFQGHTIYKYFCMTNFRRNQLHTIRFFMVIFLYHSVKYKLFFTIWNFIHCNAKMLRTIWQFYLRDLLKKGKKIILRKEEMTILFLWISNRNFVIRLLSCGHESSIAKHKNTIICIVIKASISTKT